MEQVRQEATSRPFPQIEVIGHTDTVGSVPINDYLSRRRAQVVGDFLGENGFDPTRIEISGRGEREPLVKRKDEVAEAKNRRVEISIR